MRFIISFLFVLVVFNLSGQSKLYYSIELGPGISFREYQLALSSITDDGISGKELYDDFKERVDEDENHQFAFSIAGKVHYKFHPNFMLLSGLTYKNIGEKLIAQEIDQIASFQGYYIPVYSGEKVKYNFRYHYLAIPFELKYSFREIEEPDKITLGLLTGLEFNLLVSDNFAGKDFGYYTAKPLYAELPKFAFSVTSAIFIEKVLKNRNFLFVQAQMTYFLTPNAKYDFGNDIIDFVVHQYNYFYEIKIGYRFGKNQL